MSSQQIGKDYDLPINCNIGHLNKSFGAYKLTSDLLTGKIVKIKCL